MNRLMIRLIKWHTSFCFECKTPALLLRELELRLIHAHVRTVRSDLDVAAGRQPAPRL